MGLAVWVHGQPDKRRRDQGTEIDTYLRVKNGKSNRREANFQRMVAKFFQRRQLQKFLEIEDSQIAKDVKFAIVDLKNSDITVKNNRYFQINQVLHSYRRKQT